MANYIVTAKSGLRLRSTATATDSGNILTLLVKDEIVRVLDDSDATWYRVSCRENPAIEGFAAAQYLIKDPESNKITGIRAVNMVGNSGSARTNRKGYAYPLAELDMPMMNATTITSRIDSMHTIVSYLQVDKSLRYQKADGKTYCNVYAYDYCYLTGAYLPRVWWYDTALLQLKSGISMSAKLGISVYEVKANRLYDWLDKWGLTFGWQRTYDLDDLQAKVNEGTAGLICGKNRDDHRSGHICCVIPETGTYTANRTNSKVTCPLTSQAGSNNFQLNIDAKYRNYVWWKSSQIIQMGFWYWKPDVEA